MRVRNFAVFLIVVLSVSLSSFLVAAFQFNGTTYDVNGTALNGTNISVLIKNSSWADVSNPSNLSNASGWFQVELDGNATTNYMYMATVIHTNTTSGAVDYVGQSLPLFPYSEFSGISNVNFYLKTAGTINITVVNRTGARVNFSYQIKDTRLGFPISSSWQNDGYEVDVYVPTDRNYSIMVYPQNSLPMSFNWNNFSSSTSYNITNANLSKYEATTRTLYKKFNATEDMIRVTGYINTTLWNITGWDNFTIVPYILEPGNMIYVGSGGGMPYNMSAWNNGQSDIYNLSSGYYNITLPASTETSNYLLFATARNGTGSGYYGGFVNISLSYGSSDIVRNITLYGLLGSETNITLSNAAGAGNIAIPTAKQTFNLINASGSSLTQASAHIETSVDYSSYDSVTGFTIMDDVGQTGSAAFSFPMLNVTGFKEMNVYSQQYSPKRLSRTISQILGTNGTNITLSSFSPQDIDGQLSASSITIALYKSNSSCDVPNPSSSCLVGSSADLSSFNPLSAIIGGGKLSFRMGTGNISVHYVNVDMLASGPPDALFDSNANKTNASAGSLFSQAFRFGSSGPTIYDYVLISIPYNESTGGLNDSAQINASVSEFYDDNWNVIWNATNGTDAGALAGNYSHYATHQNEWEVLMNSSTNCTINLSVFNVTNPCYVDTTNNKIWLMLPHFSGTGASISGSSPSASSSSSSSSGGGGGGGDNFKTYTISQNQFKAGYNKKLRVNDRIRFNILDDFHYVIIAELTNTTATINVSSETQQKTFSIGDIYNFDVTNDGEYDLEVTLENIDKVTQKANITIMKTTGKVVSGSNEEETIAAGEGDQSGVPEESSGQSAQYKKKSFLWLWILIAVIVIILGVGIWFFIRNSK